MASLPDLYSVVSYNTDHLTTAATHWENTANQWENTFRQMNAQAQKLPWEGQSADAAVERTHGDMLVAVNRADQLRDAATTARGGASQLNDLKKQVIERIRDAQNDGFDVGDDYSVTDRYQTIDPIQAAQRQGMAETYAADLVHRSAALLARDNEVGADIHSHAGDVGVGMFTGGDHIDGGNYHPGQGRVQAVDNSNESEWDKTKKRFGQGFLLGAIPGLAGGPETAIAGGIVTGGLNAIGGMIGDTLDGHTQPKPPASPSAPPTVTVYAPPPPPAPGTVTVTVPAPPPPPQ